MASPMETNQKWQAHGRQTKITKFRISDFLQTLNVQYAKITLIVYSIVNTHFKQSKHLIRYTTI